MTCAADNCGRPVHGHGLCTTHYSRDYYRQHRDRRRTAIDKWRKGKGKQREAQRTADWKRANRERMLAYNRAWTRAHPEIVAERNARRRAARHGASDATLTNLQWLAICEAQDGRCVYCDVPCKLTQDHVIPLIRGGAHTVENVVGACQPCNSRKRDRTAEEFAPTG